MLVVGATGFVGRHLLSYLAARHVRAVALTLSPGSAAPPPGPGPVVHRRGDREDPRVLDALRRLGPYDAVVDLICYRPQHAATTLRHLGGAARRYVLLSTLAVYRTALHRHAGEDDLVVHRDGSSSYGSLKAGCERLLDRAAQRGEIELVIVRSAPLFGPLDPVSREGFLLDRLIRGAPIYVPGDPASPIEILFVRDLARALVTAALGPPTVCGTHHLAQRERLTLGEHVRRIAALSDRSPDLRPLPPQAWTAMGLNPYAFPFAPLQPDPNRAVRLDCRRAHRALHLRTTPHRRAVAETVEWLTGTPAEERPIWPGSASTQSCLTGTHPRLYRQAEAYLEGDGERDAWPPPLQPPQILELFTGSPHADPTLRAEGPSGEADRAGAGRRRVVVPEPWLRWIPERPRQGPEPSATPARQLPAVVEALLVPHQTTPQTALLHCRANAARATGYRFENTPPTVRFLPFRHFTDELTPAPNQFLVLGEERSEDRHALHGWLEQLGQRGVTTIRPHVHATIFLSGAALAAAPEAPAAAWVALFPLARLASAALEPPETTLRVLRPRAGPLPPESALFLLHAPTPRDRWLLADAARRRLWELSADLGSLLAAERTAGTAAWEEAIHRLVTCGILDADGTTSAAEGVEP